MERGEIQFEPDEYIYRDTLILNALSDSYVALPSSPWAVPHERSAAQHLKSAAQKKEKKKTTQIILLIFAPLLPDTSSYSHEMCRVSAGSCAVCKE